MAQEEKKSNSHASKGKIKLMATGAAMGMIVGGVLLIEASKSCAIDPAQAKLMWLKTVGVTSLFGAAFGVCVHKVTGRLANKPVFAGDAKLVDEASVGSKEEVVFVM